MHPPRSRRRLFLRITYLTQMNLHLFNILKNEKHVQIVGATEGKLKGFITTCTWCLKPLGVVFLSTQGRDPSCSTLQPSF